MGLPPTKAKVHAPAGYDTDLASIPRVGWMVVAPWDVARAAIIHDVLYGALREALTQKKWDEKVINEMRKAADNVFREGMEAAEPKIANVEIFTLFLVGKTFRKIRHTQAGYGPNVTWVCCFGFC